MLCFFIKLGLKNYLKSKCVDDLIKIHRNNGLYFDLFKLILMNNNKFHLSLYIFSLITVFM